MVPVEARLEDSLIPIAAITTHLTIAVLLTGLIARSSYRSYLVLPPSQATRARQATRKNNVVIFGALAAVSAALSAYWACSYLNLSYHVWAHDKGVDIQRSSRIIRWLSDIDIYTDYFEIVAEKARRFWWRQQLDLSAIPWGLLLMIEGRRRNIPHLWAYMLLAQLVSFSFAQNLFFVTLLLTPVPLPDNVRELTGESRVLTRLAKLQKRAAAKPENWVPSANLYYACLLLSFGAVILTPMSHNTTSFIATTMVSHFLPFLPLALPYVVPESWGAVHSDPHQIHQTYTRLYKITSLVSVLLHGKSTVFALVYNDPGSTYHRHSLLHPLKVVHRTALERSGSAMGKILGAISDHPAVGAVGWDVLITGLSLGLWAALRGLDARAVLASSGLPNGEEVRRATHEAAKKIEEATNDASFDLPSVDDLRRATHKAAKKIEKATNDASVDLPNIQLPNVQLPDIELPSVDTIRRGAHKAAKKIEAVTNEVVEKVEEEVPQTRSRRGRARKSASVDETPAVSTGRATRGKKAEEKAKKEEKEKKKEKEEEELDDEDDEEEDATYVPDHPVMTEGDDVEEADWEVGALVWGIVSAMGLGSGSAGVFGAESVAR